MDWTCWTSLRNDEIKSIHDFTCNDPFSILGAHPLETDVGIQTAVRVYIPGASFISGVFLESEQEFDLMKLGDTGFFEATLEREFEPELYKLNITLENGVKYSVIDPYAFTPILTEFDLHLLTGGTHYELYRKLGANILEHQGVEGVHFAVWAPSARSLAVVGDFNSWDGRRHLMRSRGSTGIWEIFIPNLGAC